MKTNTQVTMPCHFIRGQKKKSFILYSAGKNNHHHSPPRFPYETWPRGWKHFWKCWRKTRLVYHVETQRGKKSRERSVSKTAFLMAIKCIRDRFSLCNVELTLDRIFWHGAEPLLTQLMPRDSGAQLEVCFWFSRCQVGTEDLHFSQALGDTEAGAERTLSETWP